MPTTYDDDAKFLKSLGGTPPGNASAPTAKPSVFAPPDRDMSDEPLSQQFRTGLRQGFLGYAEAPAYYAEKGIRKFAPNFRMPLHEWAKAYRDRAESTTAGLAGEVTGTMAPLLLPGIGELGFGARAAMGAEDLARMAQLARAVRAGESAVGGLKLTAPAAATMGERAASLAERVGPTARGAIRGGVGSLMAQPATSPEEVRNQLLSGALFGAAGRNLGRNIPRTEPEFRRGVGFRRARTPESINEELKRVMEGKSKWQRIREKIPRTLGHAIGHPLGHALFAPGGGFVGGHALAGIFEAIARGGRSAEKAETDLLRLVRRAARRRKGRRIAGPLGEVLAPAMGYPLSGQDEESVP